MNAFLQLHLSAPMPSAAARVNQKSQPVVAGHNMFQNPHAFIDSNGSKCLQEQALLAGRYFINPPSPARSLEKLS